MQGPHNKGTQTMKILRGVVAMVVMMRRTRLGVFVLLFTVVCGCVQTANSPHQYQELKRLSRQGHRFKVSFSGDLPIAFQDFGISVVGPTNNTLGSQANMIVKGETDALQQALRLKVVAVYPGKADGEATGLVVDFEFRQQDGATCGSETVLLNLESGEYVGITLRDIAKQGSPYSIAAKPTAVIWKWGDEEVSVTIQQPF